MKKDSTALQDELKDLSPFLYEQKLKQQEPGGDGFRLPPGYFDAVEEAVFARLEASGARHVVLEKRGIVRGLFQSRVMLAAAAMIVLVLAALWFFRPAPAVAPAAAELSEEDIEAYVLENIRDFDTDQLASLSPVESTATEEEHTGSSKPKTDKPSLDDLSPEDVENVLRDMSEEELQELL